MTKKVIGIGSVVDDFTGDYLRQGGQKINDNFTEIYDELGDSSRVHAAGAFKTFTAVAGPNVLNALPGEAWHIDTTLGSVTVNLPLIDNPNDGRVIKLSDSRGSWSVTNSVTVIHDPLDTINSNSGPVVFESPYQIITLVQTDPSDWKYAAGIFHDHISLDATTVSKIKHNIVGSADIDGQITVPEHSENSINVFLNGVLLSYDALDLVSGGTSEYGSSLTGVGDGLTAIGTVPLQIQLRPGIYAAGDVVTIETFSGSFAGVRTSYTRQSRRLVNSLTLPLSEYLYVPTVVGNEFQSVPLQDLGINDVSVIRPDAFEFYYNGVLMTEAGSAGFTGNNQYKLVQNLGVYNEIWFTSPAAPLYGTDVVTAVYFNNILGSLLDMNDIETAGNDLWVKRQAFSISKKMSYTNKAPINPANEINTQAANATFSSATPVTEFPSTVLDIMYQLYPVGTVYENATNPNNPALYLGFGVWAPFSVGKSSVGFDASNPDLDEVGISVGAASVTLTAANIPELPVTPQAAVMFLDDSGQIDISGCLPDPNAPIANPASISQITQIANDGVTPAAINTRTPSIVSYKWVRIQ